MCILCSPCATHLSTQKVADSQGAQQVLYICLRANAQLQLYILLPPVSAAAVHTVPTSKNMHLYM